MMKKGSNVVTEQGLELSAGVVEGIIKYGQLTTADPTIGETLVMNRPIFREDDKGDDELVGFIFDSNKRASVKVSVNDLKRFTLDGKLISETFQFRGNDKCFVQRQFTVKDFGEHLNQQGKMIYPLYCYELYDSVSAELEEGESFSNEQYTRIYDSGAKDVFEEKYYRTIDIDVAILYYPGAKVAAKKPRAKKTPKPAPKK